MIRLRQVIIVPVLVCLLSAFALAPCRVLAAEQQSGIVTFTDGDIDHYYAKGDNISFSIGPFPCQSGKTDYLVFGIMEKVSSDFAVSDSPLEGLASSEKGYYMTVTADSDGFFDVSGQISAAADQLPAGVLAVKIYSSDWNLVVNEKTGTGAFIPVVAADGTPALIIGKTSTGKPADPLLANSLVSVDGNDDLDCVYFHGQQISINFTIPNTVLLSYLPVRQLTVTSGIFEDLNVFNTEISPLTINLISATGSGLKIDATVNNPDNITLPSGVLGVKLNLPSTISGIPGATDMQQPMPVVSSLGKAVIAGVKVPSNMFVNSNPPLAEIKNLYNTEQAITFTKGSQGSITFVPGLDIIDNRNELAALDQNVNINFDLEKQNFVFEVKTSALSFLRGKSAGIKAYGVMEKLGLDNLPGQNITEFINMAVVDEEGKTVPLEHIGDYIDQENVNYDYSTDILTIPVKHFTRYEIGAGGNAPAAGALTASPESINLKAGEYKQIVLTADMSDGVSMDVTDEAEWISDNPLVATVNAGMVSAVSSGCAVITASYKDRIVSVPVNVAGATVDLRVNPELLNLEVGGKAGKISVFATVNGKTYDVTKKCEFEVYDEDVAKVDSKGKVTATGGGDTVINVTFQGESVEVPVTAVAKLKKIVVEPKSLKLRAGDLADIAVTGVYANGVEEDVTDQAVFTSSKERICTVEDGTVYAEGVGSAKITVTVGKLKKTVSVKVAR
ncbi:MAG: Bacterial Ig-like domain (group 2) [Pelotomaculum sp. PtaU1.Bin035]|nr:MAG: Bacterial Ig-like domain (group 2) [Pelotomaculum sp. PtaU1.Bin035]